MTDEQRGNTESENVEPDDEDFTWVDDVANALVSVNITTDATLASKMALLKSLKRQNQDLTLKLTTLQGRLVLQEENERLRLELSALGPPDMMQEVEMYKNMLAQSQAESKVLLKQRDALANALRAERVQRQQLEQPNDPGLDPCG